MAYYLPIKSTSLPHYFVCACVKPASFFENKPQDIQDRFPNYLLVSKELGTKDTDCCIELVLTKDEESLLIQCGNSFYLLSIPLPLSRVKKVFFRNKSQLEQTVSNINLSAAFVPYSLTEVAKFFDLDFNSDFINDKIVDNDYYTKLKLFDRLLGALALMKTAKEPYMNYSENYASTLSFFNDLIKEDLKRQGHKIEEKFFVLFSRNNNFLRYLQYLENQISKEVLDKIAAENNQIIERSHTKAINLDKLDDKTYIFAILQSYGVGSEAATKKIDSLISNNFHDLSRTHLAEGVALYYGYNRGYTVFSNCYRTSETKMQSVKFHLESQLDYYTIESVYQFVFNARMNSSSFPFIDGWCPKKKEEPNKKTDYKILDTVFIGKKKTVSFFKRIFARYFGRD